MCPRGTSARWLALLGELGTTGRVGSQEVSLAEHGADDFGLGHAPGGSRARVMGTSFIHRSCRPSALVMKAAEDGQCDDVRP
jgi:hypothetical protein